MKIWIQDDNERILIGTATTMPEAFEKINEWFNKKLEQEREQMGIDNDALKALKTLRDWMK